MPDQNKNNLTKNTAFYITALILQKIISFSYFSFIATRLGSENIGKYFFALSFTAIFSILVDLGIINILIRNTAKDYNSGQKLLSLNLSIKIFMAFFIYLSVIASSYLLNYSHELKTMIALSGIIMVLDSFTLTFYGAFRGFHNLKIESLGTIIFQLIVACAGWLITRYTNSPTYLLLALVLASLFNFLYSLVLTKVKLKLKIRPEFNFKEIILMLKTAIPFALAGIFTKIYAFIDTVFLSLFATSHALGYYSLPYKMTFALQFIPLAFMASLYPIFSSFYKKDDKQLANYYQTSIFLLLSLALPVVIGTIILADKLILKIYGQQYAPSILSLQILMFGLVFVFLNFPASYLMNACHQQSKLTKNIALIMIFNIVLNIYLIKFLSLSFIGASIASTLSSIILFFLNYSYTLKLVKFSQREIFKKNLKLVFCAALMAATLYFFKNNFNIIINIIIGGLVYLMMIVLTKSFTPNDLVNLYRAIFKKAYEKNIID